MPLEGLCSPTEAWLFYYGWSRVYDVMQPFFTSPEMREAGLDLGEVSGPLAVLDVGAGTGTLSLQVAARCGADKLTLLDQSAQMLNQAKEKPALKGCEMKLSDASTDPLPFADDSFDRVVSSGVFYYFPRPVEALQEQMRVCRPGGKVLVMGSLQPKPWLIRLFAQTFNRFPTEEQYLGWFQASGLADIEYKHVSNPWNTQQYAIAICGTVPPTGSGKAAAARPTSESATTSAASGGGGSAFTRRLRSVAYLPVALARFGLALAAFAVVGPLQVMNAAAGMRRLRLSQQAESA